jgi:hypothetical protein
MISPSPQRIIWLYKRWQPLYDEIRLTVFPRVEFIQGIPMDLEQDTFVQPNTHNLVILDDLMSCATKDSRVNELFTEGSHHRNMSVIALNQNLYFNKDPTQRRNCHYLVMFNNPVDQQQIMTLARQMYPGNSQHLIRHFKEATSKPYGYLVIDLKPFTSDHQRLRTDIFDQSTAEKLKIPQRNIIKEQPSNIPIHTDQNHQTERTHPIKSIEDGHYEDTCDSYQTCFNLQSSLFDTMQSCDYCGLVFQDIHDLQRHLKDRCPEVNEKEDASPRWLSWNNNDESIDGEEPMDTDDESRENEVFDALMQLSKSDDVWEKKYKKYVKEGMDADDIKRKAEEKTKATDIKKSSKIYAILISYILKLKNGTLHEHVMEDVDDFIDKGYDENKSINMPLSKNRHYIDNMWEDDDKEEDIETDEDDESNDDDVETD